MKTIVIGGKIYLLSHLVWFDKEISKPKHENPYFSLKFTEGNYKTIHHPSINTVQEKHKQLIEFLYNSDTHLILM